MKEKLFVVNFLETLQVVNIQIRSREKGRKLKIRPSNHVYFKRLNI